MEIRKQALEEERKRREELEKRLQEETSRRQKLIDREVKLREKQRAQVRKMDLVEILSKKKNNTTSKLSKWLCWDHFLIFYYFVFPSFQSRPLTRYLPVRKDDFDLRAHIESAGHSTDTCFHLSISEKTCRGYLVKMGGKIKTWKKRWFVFDRNRRTLSYFAGEIEHRSKIWKIPTSSSSSCWDMDIFFTIPNQLCSPLF